MTTLGFPPARVQLPPQSSLDGVRRPPLIPLFVLGFLACAAVRTAGVMSAPVLGVVRDVQTAALGAALFGMGTSVHVRSLLKGSGGLVTVGAISTIFITGVALVGVLLVAA